MSNGRNNLMDFLLRAVWVVGYAILIRVFILLRKIESLFERRSKEPRTVSEPAVHSGNARR